MPRLSEKTLDRFMFDVLDRMEDAVDFATVDGLRNRQRDYRDALERLENNVRKKEKNNDPQKSPMYAVLSDYIEVQERGVWIKQNAARYKEYFGEKPASMDEEEWQKGKKQALEDIREFINERPKYLKSRGTDFVNTDTSLAGIEESRDDKRLFDRIHSNHNMDYFAMLGEVVAQYPSPGIEQSNEKEQSLTRKDEYREIWDSVRSDLWNDMPGPDKDLVDHKQYVRYWDRASWETRFRNDPERAYGELMQKSTTVRKGELLKCAGIPYVVEKFGSENGLVDVFYAKLSIYDKVRFDPERAIKEKDFLIKPYKEKVELDRQAAAMYFNGLSNAEKYKEDKETALEYFYKNLSAEEVKKLESEIPGVTDALWKSLRPNEREKFDKERFDAEYKDLSWGDKLSMGRERAYAYFETLSPLEKYIESPNQALESFKEKPITLEQAREIDGKYANFLDNYWKGLDNEHRKNFDIERYDAEFRKLPWDKKVASDPDYTEIYWNRLSNTEKYKENKIRAIDDFVKNPISWNEVNELDKIDLGFSSDYWRKLSNEQRLQHYPERVDKDNEIEEISKGNLKGSYAWSKIKGYGEDYANKCWDKVGLEQKYLWDDTRATKELLNNKVSAGQLLKEGVSQNVVLKYINNMTPDQKLTYANSYFEHEWAGKTWDEKLSFHEEETNRRYNAAKTLPEKIKVDKQHTFDLLKADKTPLDKIRDEAGEEVKDEYFHSLTVTEKQTLYKAEYDNIWTNGSYEDKKRLDPERTKNEIFEPATYEEKRNLSREDALKWLADKPEQERNFIHPEDAHKIKLEEIENRARIPDKGKLSPQTVKEVEAAKKYVDKITNSQGKLFISKDESLYNLSKNLILADKATITDFYSIARMAHKAAYTDKLAEGSPPIMDIILFAEDKLCTKHVFQNTTDPSAPPAVPPQEFVDSFKGRLNKDGFVVLTNSQKEEFLRTIRSMSDAELKAIQKYEQGTQIVQYHNESLAAGKKMFENNPGLRNVDSKRIEIESAGAQSLIESSNLETVREMKSGVDTLKAQFNALRSHGPAFLDSKEYSNMKTAYQKFTKAYDNVMAGKHPDGKVNNKPELLSNQDLAELKSLQEAMSQAANAYTEAKRLQKGGGIDRHKTDQGTDRLAFADALSEFKLENGISEKVNNRKLEVKLKGEGGYTETISLKDLEKSAERGRKHLDYHAKRLRDKEQQKSKSSEMSKPSAKNKAM